MESEYMAQIMNGLLFVTTAAFLALYVFCVASQYVRRQRGCAFIFFGALIILCHAGLTAFSPSQFHATQGQEIIGAPLAMFELLYVLAFPAGVVLLLIGIALRLPCAHQTLRCEEKDKKALHQLEYEKETLTKALSEKSLECSTLQRQLNVAEQTKRRFLSNISHEFRTPMNTISGCVEMMLESNLTKKQQKDLFTIQESTQILTSIVDGVIELSDMDSMDFHLSEESFDMPQLLENLYVVYKDQMSQKGLEFKLESPSSLSEQLIGDRLRLFQMLSHLLSNALNSTELGSVTLKVEIEKETYKDVQLVMKVIDTGRGLEKERQAHIFDLLSKESESDGQVYGGLGLGLAVVKKIASKMGGVCGVESEVGQGSTFYLRLIFKKIHATQQEEPHPPRQNVVKRKSLSNLSILVVDDQDINLIVTSGMLKQIGVKHIETALSGEDALAKMRRQYFDLVLMDCQMPDMDGLETTVRYRRDIEPSMQAEDDQTAAHVPIVALTANDATLLQEKCFKAGMDDFMSKPSTTEDFKNMIYKWVYGVPRLD